MQFLPVEVLVPAVGLFKLDVLGPEDVLGTGADMAAGFGSLTSIA